MKKNSIVCLLAILAFNACKKQSSNNPTAVITGKWYYTSTIYTVTKNGTTTPVDTEKSNQNLYVLFNSNGTGSSNDNDYFGHNFSYKIISNNLQVTQTDTVNSTSYVVTSNIPIKKLTNNMLEILIVDTINNNDIENYDVTYSR